MAVVGWHSSQNTDLSTFQMVGVRGYAGFLYGNCLDSQPICSPTKKQRISLRPNGSDFNPVGFQAGIGIAKGERFGSSVEIGLRLSFWGSNENFRYPCYVNRSQLLKMAKVGWHFSQNTDLSTSKMVGVRGYAGDLDGKCLDSQLICSPTKKKQRILLRPNG